MFLIADYLGNLSAYDILIAQLFVLVVRHATNHSSSMKKSLAYGTSEHLVTTIISNLLSWRSITVNILVAGHFLAKGLLGSWNSTEVVFSKSS